MSDPLNDMTLRIACGDAKPVEPSSEWWTRRADLHDAIAEGYELRARGKAGKWLAVIERDLATRAREQADHAREMEKQETKP